MQSFENDNTYIYFVRIDLRQVSSLTHSVAVEEEYTVCIVVFLQAHVEWMDTVEVALTLSERLQEYQIYFRGENFANEGKVRISQIPMKAQLLKLEKGTMKIWKGQSKWNIFFYNNI